MNREVGNGSRIVVKNTKGRDRSRNLDAEERIIAPTQMGNKAIGYDVVKCV